jgi:hypothetical protein
LPLIEAAASLEKEGARCHWTELRQKTQSRFWAR